jgi:hypothetical protein
VPTLSVTGARLLVTTGLVDELANIARLPERWGRDVLHCPRTVTAGRFVSLRQTVGSSCHRTVLGHRRHGFTTPTKHTEIAPHRTEHRYPEESILSAESPGRQATTAASPSPPGSGPSMCMTVDPRQAPPGCCGRACSPTATPRGDRRSARCTRWGGGPYWWIRPAPAPVVPRRCASPWRLAPRLRL